MPACASWRRDGSGKAEQGEPWREGPLALGVLRWPPPCPFKVQPVRNLSRPCFGPLVYLALGHQAHSLSLLPLPAWLHPLPASLPDCSLALSGPPAMLQPELSGSILGIHS